jgi:hypothetical protein
MPKDAEIPKLPAIVPGEWRVQLLGGGSLHLGCSINREPKPHSIEFSFMTLPVFASGPAKIGLAAVVVLICPAALVVQEHSGCFMQNGLVTMIDLSVTRALFSDLVQRLEARKVNQITFKAEEGAEGRLPVTWWSIEAVFPEA